MDEATTLAGLVGKPSDDAGVKAWLKQQGAPSPS